MLQVQVLSKVKPLRKLVSLEKAVGLVTTFSICGGFLKTSKSIFRILSK